MKIFSNFDTKFKKVVLNNKRQSFPDEEIFIITRSRYYLIFKVLFHFIGYIIVLGILLGLLEYINAYAGVYIGLILVWFLVFWFRVFHKFLKYKYDFAIVTPKGITTFKQKGILQSITKEIPSKRIKAIEISRAAILGNIFGYGSVEIIADLSENSHLGRDNEAPWVVGLTYVDNPYSVKERISKSCFH